MKLQNKIAVITGAGKGIGKATAGLFLKEGAKVVLTSRNLADLELSKRNKTNRKEKITVIAGDVSKEETVNRIIEKTISIHGKIDILVNNAGFGIFDDLVDQNWKILMQCLTQMSVRFIC